jgi:hypothetical protein
LCSVLWRKTAASACEMVARTFAMPMPVAKCRAGGRDTVRECLVSTSPAWVAMRGRKMSAGWVDGIFGYLRCPFFQGPRQHRKCRGGRTARGTNAVHRVLCPIASPDIQAWRELFVGIANCESWMPKQKLAGEEADFVLHPLLQNVLQPSPFHPLCRLCPHLLQAGGQFPSLFLPFGWFG